MNPTTRPLTASELTGLHKFNVRVTRLLNDFDAIKHTSVYRHEVKAAGNRFEKVLEAAVRPIWKNDFNQEELIGAMDEMHLILDFAENMELTCMGLEGADPKRVEHFYRDLEKLFKKHGLPLAMDGKNAVLLPK